MVWLDLKETAPYCSSLRWCYFVWYQTSIEYNGFTKPVWTQAVNKDTHLSSAARVLYVKASVLNLFRQFLSTCFHLEQVPEAPSDIKTILKCNQANTIF